MLPGSGSPTPSMAAIHAACMLCVLRASSAVLRPRKLWALKASEVGDGVGQFLAPTQMLHKGVWLVWRACMWVIVGSV